MADLGNLSGSREEIGSKRDEFKEIHNTQKQPMMLSLTKVKYKYFTDEADKRGSKIIYKK